MRNWLIFSVLLASFMGIVACAPSLRGDKWEERELAVKNLSANEQETLSEMALYDIDWNVRLAAVKKLTNQLVLCKVATTDRAWNGYVQSAAVDRINDQSLLVKVAVDSDREETRLKARSKLNNDSKRSLELPESTYLNNSNDIERLNSFIKEYPTGPYTGQIRSRLEEALKTQARKAEIDAEQKRNSAKAELVEMDKLKNIFAKYTPKSTSFEQLVHDININHNAKIDRRNCISYHGVNEQGKRIDNDTCSYKIDVMGKHFCSIVFINKIFDSVNYTDLYNTSTNAIDNTSTINLYSNNYSERYNAIITNTSLSYDTLSRIVAEDNDSEIRRIAFVKFKDRALAEKRPISIEQLYKVAANDKDSYVRIIAIREISDQTILEKIYSSESDVNVRKEVVKKINNQSTLSKIATEDSDNEIRIKAISNLTDQKLLEVISRNESSPDIRSNAIIKLTNNVIIANILKGEKDKTVVNYVLSALEPNDSQEVLSIINH